MIELSLNNIKKYMDATLVLEDISFQVYDGEKVGIVGVNGSGKSTILKLIAGVLTIDREDKGWISLTKGTTVGYLEQIPNYPSSMKVYDILNLSFLEIDSLEKDMRDLEKEMKHLEGDEVQRALKKYSFMQQKYDALGGYDKEEKLSKVCKGLKLDDSFLNKEFEILSGGEKTTVLLGKILLQNPDLLLLDEPTNHLDMESMEWLEAYLKSYKGIVIIVSHDRYFLDNVVTKIIEIEDMTAKTYKGNYSSYLKQKEEDMMLQFADFKEQQKKINAMKKTIKDLRDWAQRADNNKFFRRAASLQKQLDKMEIIDKPDFDRENIKLNFITTERSGNDVIKVKDLCKSFEDKIIFKNANLIVNYRERVALIGANGCGKSTFLKILLGELPLDKGEAKLGSNVKAAYLPQQISFNDEEQTVLQCFREDIVILEGKAREYLSKYMFFGSTVFKKVKHLSGGERIRLKLSKLLYEDINVLILDEPTNHLDIDSIETLEEALESFKGTIFFISHDRYFINKLGQRVIAIEEHSFKSYAGNYDFYKEEKSKQLKEKIQESEKKKEKPKRVRYVDENKKRQENIAEIEAKISSLEEEISGIDKTMSIESTDYEKLNKLFNKKSEIQKELDEAIKVWEDLNIQQEEK